MSPREATNLFPDQYLTLDYEPNGPPTAIAPPVIVDNHNNTNNGNNMEAIPGLHDHINNDNDDAMNHHNHMNGFENHLHTLVNGTAPTLANTNSMNNAVGGNNNAMNMENPLSFLNAENNAVSGLSTRHVNAVDPLSIDPTDSNLQMASSNHDLGVMSNNSMTDPLNLSMNMDITASDHGNMTQAVAVSPDTSNSSGSLNGNVWMYSNSNHNSNGNMTSLTSTSSNGNGNTSSSGTGFRLFSRHVSQTNVSNAGGVMTTNIIRTANNVHHQHHQNNDHHHPVSVTPSPNSRSRRLHSVLDQSLSVDSDTDDEDNASHLSCPPGLDITNDSSTTVHQEDDTSSLDDDIDTDYNFPLQYHHAMSSYNVGNLSTPNRHSTNNNNVALTETPTSNTSTLLSAGTLIQSSPDSTPSVLASSNNNNHDNHANHTSSTVTSDITSHHPHHQEQLLQHLSNRPNPLYRNDAFEHNYHNNNTTNHPIPHSQSSTSNANSPQLSLAFGPNTLVSDLKYFAERGCIVALLQALHTTKLKTLGCRMLADYAKMPSRRVAVASNKRILEFVMRTVSERSQPGTDTVEWLGREYAVETVRSLTATEESDTHLLNCPGMLRTLAGCAMGGPFVNDGTMLEQQQENVGLASGRARLHACIAIMNLSCGKSNKVKIAKLPEVLEAMRDAMLMRHYPPSSSDSSDDSTNSYSENKRHAQEARLKATTCIKNLSNADANDGALLACTGLVEALGHVARVTAISQQTQSISQSYTPQQQQSDATTTTNACLALMNLSISKANKHVVFRTPGVMDALMSVISVPPSALRHHHHNHHHNNVNVEAKIKACSALSNLAIGYDNKIPMFHYPGFVDSILQVIQTDRGEARTKACSILWSFAAEMKNQVPVVKRGDILPMLVRVAEEDTMTEARFKCVAALTLLAESLENAIPLLESGALAPLMDILLEAGPDPTQWKGQTASWCVGFLMNMAQSDEAVPSLREAGVVELLAPLLTLDHYQSLKAAMAVTFVCRYDEGDETYDLLRKTETVIPKIISLLHNTLSGRGGNGYKYGVFTLRSSVGCIASLASGPDFMKERIATGPVYESLLRVLSDFCVEGGTPGAIVGGGRDDTLSPTLAIRALHELTGHLIPTPTGRNNSGLPFGKAMDERLTLALNNASQYPQLQEKDRVLARETMNMILGRDINSRNASNMSLSPLYNYNNGTSDDVLFDHNPHHQHRVRQHHHTVSPSPVPMVCCGLTQTDSNVSANTNNMRGSTFNSNITHPPPAVIQSKDGEMEIVHASSNVAPTNVIMPGGIVQSNSGGNDTTSDDSSSSTNETAVRTFLLADGRGRRFAVPIDPSGGRRFNDDRVWCYRRGRFCRPDEVPDPNFRWTMELQRAYQVALAIQGRPSGTDNVLSAHSY